MTAQHWTTASKGRDAHTPLTRQDVDAAVQALPTSGYEYGEWLGVCGAIIAAYIESGDGQDAAIGKALDWSKGLAAHNESDAAFAKRWTGKYDPAKRTPAQLIARATKSGWKRQKRGNAAQRPVGRSKGKSTQHTSKGRWAQPTRESETRSNGQATKARPKEQSELADYDFCERAGRWLDSGQALETADALARTFDASADMAAIIGRAYVDAEPLAHPLGWQRRPPDEPATQAVAVGPWGYDTGFAALNGPLNYHKN